MIENKALARDNPDPNVDWVTGRRSDRVSDLDSRAWFVLKLVEGRGRLGPLSFVSRPVADVPIWSRVSPKHLKGDRSRMTKVVLRQGESPESLLRRFRKQVTKDRILSEAKKKRYFVSKSEQRRIAKRKAIRRERRRKWKLAARQGRW